MRTEAGERFCGPGAGTSLRFTDAVNSRLLAFCLGWAVRSVGLNGLMGVRGSSLLNLGIGRLRHQYIWI